MGNKYKKCPVCNNFLWRNRVRYSKCNFCGLILKDSDLNNLEKLNKILWNDVVKGMGKTDIRLARLYAVKLLHFLRLNDFSGLKILEFGAGRGDMLKALIDLKADVYAVEPFAYDYLSRKNIKVFRNLEDLPKNTLFDGIISIDVIEHLISPVNDMRKLYEFLAPHGWLFIATPNTNCLSAKLSGKNWKQLSIPCHLYLFNDRAIRKLFFNLNFNKFVKLHWFVCYSRNFFIMFSHFFLQLLRLDGEMRYMVFK